MKNRFLTGVAYAVSLVLIGGLGVGLGRLIGRNPSVPPKVEWETGLVVGQPFPDVALVSASGDTLNTRSLFQGAGRVLVFIDPRCGSCRDASHRWQVLLDEGALEPPSVVGITTASPKEAESYRREQGLDFAIYTDVKQTLEHDYGVTGLPYEVVVGASGRVRSTSVNFRRKVDLSGLKRELGS